MRNSRQSIFATFQFFVIAEHFLLPILLLNAVIGKFIFGYFLGKIFFFINLWIQYQFFVCTGNFHELIYIYQMKINYFLVALSIFVSSSHAQCSNCVQLSYSDTKCKVCYNNCTTVQISQFISCQHRFCAQQSSDSCNRYDTRQQSETTCLNKCCNSSIATFSPEKLNQCYQEYQKNKRLAIAIFTSIFLGLPFIIFVICWVKNGGYGCCSGCSSCSCGSCGYCISDCFQCLGDCLKYICCCKCLKRNDEQQNGESAVMQMTKIEYLKWRQGQTNPKIVDDTTICPICLNNRVNVETECIHFFHLQCIFEWSNRSKQCPLCKKQKLNNLKYYCRGCCTRYININAENFNKEFLNKLKIQGQNCQVCR